MLKILKKYLFEKFNYVCFPSSFNIELEIYSSHLNIQKVIGTRYIKILLNKMKNEKLVHNEMNEKLKMM